MAQDNIFPILKQNADTSDYAQYIFYLKIAIWIVIALITLRIIVYFIQRHIIPAYKIQNEDDQFFLAMARAFGLEEEEKNSLKRLVAKEKLEEPIQVFCSPKVLDPCLNNEIKRVQKNKFLTDCKKGDRIFQMYQIRRKIF